MKKSEVKDLHISYSSSNTFQGCQRKFYYQKVAKVTPDSDREDDGKALRLGKAFHQALELCKHDKKAKSNDIFKKAFNDNLVDNRNEQGLVVAMVNKYLEFHSRTNLKVVGIELEVGDRINYIGYVDVILADDNGNWWIVDLKTAARLNTSLLSRLSRDPQLNVYAYFAEDIADRLGLDIEKFQGVRYRVTTKATIKMGAREKFPEFVARCYDRIESYDIAVPKDKLIPEKVYKHFMVLLGQMRKLSTKNEEDVPQNYTYCETYFKPCEYWSQCYGKTFTENAELYQILDSDTVGDLTVAVIDNDDDLNFL
jgi:hypothetical protein